MVLFRIETSVISQGCLFSFRVIDLGVMVPCDQILREAVTQKAGTVTAETQCCLPEQ